MLSLYIERGSREYNFHGDYIFESLMWKTKGEYMRKIYNIDNISCKLE